MGIIMLNAQNNIDFDGEIASDVVWDSNIDTVKIIGDVFIDTVGTLTIESGVVIEFQGTYRIDVEGSIEATGTESNPVIFTVSDTTGFSSYSHDGWEGIDFENTDVAAEASVFEFCEFYYAYDSYGGALDVGDVNNLRISDCTFKYNYADSYGGAIFFEDASDVIISDCTFKYNYADSYGGAIHTKNTILKIEDCLFEENYANGYGGALNIAGSGDDATEVELLNNTFLKNYTTDRGGALRLVAEKGSYIANNIFEYNIAEYMGGAIFVGGDEDSTIFINNFIANNTSGTETSSGSGGGGIRTSGSCTPVFINNIIVNNTSFERGGGFLSGYDSAPMLINCVIANNKSEDSGGGLFVSCDYDYDVYIHNSIIYSNEDLSDDADQVYISYVGDPTVHFYNCNIEGDTTDMYLDSGDKDDIVYLNNINETPVFANATSGAGSDYETSPEDWMLEESAPCIDAGDITDLSFWIPTYDYFGNDRVIGDAIDIGAHEFEADAGTGIADANISNESSLKIYPNPASEIVYIEASANKYQIIEIIDITGKVLIYDYIMNEKEQINVSALHNGLYFVKVSNQSDSKVKRLVIE